MNLTLKPTQKEIKAYYESLAEFAKHGVSKETSVRAAFADLLKHCARQFKGPEGKWTLIEEYSYPLASGTRGAIDGAILTDLSIPIGYWEAKDLGDDLPKEVKKKFKIGYPQTNILFQTPESAILYQAGAKIGEYDLREVSQLIKCLLDFFAGAEEDVQWEEAVENFKVRIKDFGNDLEALIETERKENKRFAEAFSGFTDLCRQSINPNLSDKAVEEMLIQHLLTRRIFASVFAQGEFLQRNPIGQEIEKVVHALTTRHFNPTEFFASIEHYYARIESKARDIQNWEEKQQFLNTIYEKFFQGFSVKVADTHGIVYTPQPIVDFMVRSVQHILKTEFNRTLASEGVHILDPFVGTGNFIMRIIREIGATQKSALPRKYKSELHCNEVMLLPYYIASMNIEHEYYRQLGQHEPFDGICLVDTFELAEPAQTSLFSTENTERVERQKRSPIFVVIGNPPYNSKQVSENDKNKNRKYKALDDQISSTYSKDSVAVNKNSLYDPYVLAIKWATNRIGSEGMVAVVSNSSFLDQRSFDGMRKHLAKDFDRIYIYDLKGDVRKDSMREGIPIGEANTVFGLAAMVGISISFFVKGGNAKKQGIYYKAVDWKAKRTEKFKQLRNDIDILQTTLLQIEPDAKGNWLTEGEEEGFANFLRLDGGEKNPKAVFESSGLGVNTNRDDWVWNHSEEALRVNINTLLTTYNSDISKIGAPLTGKAKQKFQGEGLTFDDTKVKWSSSLIDKAARGIKGEFNDFAIRYANYRPFTKEFLYYDELLTHRRGKWASFLPKDTLDNRVICVNTAAAARPFYLLAVAQLADLHFTGDSQCFPFYTYTEDGSTRRENITDWALGEFRAAVRVGGKGLLPGPAPETKSKSKKQSGVERSGTSLPSGRSTTSTHTERERHIEKWDIFYYVYGLLHHPGYRTKYAANLRRELPRIPLPKDAAQFWAFSDAGKRLADLHVGYESAPEYDLKEQWDDSFDLRVEKMKLTKDKTFLIYNDHLTLTGIPAEAFDYRLGNRSALDWIVDQYQASTDKRSGITNDPNRADEPDYILRLIKRVTHVSVETVRIVRDIEGLALD